MAFLTVGNEQIYYEDHGTGKPVVLIHGWPLSGRAWEKQVPALLDAGFRVITYDRRGFGESSRPVHGYDYDTLAADLKALLEKLDLRDAALVGFSMGGGEVARYLGKYGKDGRASKAVFLAAITPYMLEKNDPATFEGIKTAIVADRLAFLTQFFGNFYNTDTLGGSLISDEAVRLSWNIASTASPTGTLQCVSAWLEDFRKDMDSISIPTLVIHGDSDRILPLEATGALAAARVKGSELVTIEGGPHGLTWTHADRVNAALLKFLK